jgi:hypothetical protein
MKQLSMLTILTALLVGCGQSNCNNPSQVTAVSNCSQGMGHITCDVTTQNGQTQRVVRTAELGMLSVGQNACTN